MCAGGLFFSLRTKPLQVCSESQGHPHTGLFCSFMCEKEVILARVCVDIGDVNFARNACKTHTFCKESAPCCGVPEMSLGVKGKACVHRRGSRPAPRLQGTKGFGCARGTDAPKARAWGPANASEQGPAASPAVRNLPREYCTEQYWPGRKKNQTGVELLLYGTAVVARQPPQLRVTAFVWCSGQQQAQRPPAGSSRGTLRCKEVKLHYATWRQAEVRAALSRCPA